MNLFRLLKSVSLTRGSKSLTNIRTIMTAGLDASKLEITKAQNLKPMLPNDQLVFGKTFTDHMLEIEWTKEEGWKTPKISPYHNISLDPSAVVFHYAFELFEGMKAFRDAEGKIRLFRPDKNMIRMNKSAARITLPTFEDEELIKLLEKFVLVDERFVPKGEGYSLYLRPTLIGTTASLGVGAPDKALLYVIASPVGPYYATGFKPVSLEASENLVRAWPGGVGDKKLGANYAPCIKPQLEAASRGHQQNLWLFGEEGYVTEVGTMNAFFVFEADGKKELVTAPLDGTILEGVTRDSILELCRERLPSSEWTISERPFTIKEVKEKADAGKLVEAFGAGTAAIVSPIGNISWKGNEIKVPVGSEGTGELTKTVLDWIMGIQYGKETFKNWSRVVQ